MQDFKARDVSREAASNCGKQVDRAVLRTPFNFPKVVLLNLGTAKWVFNIQVSDLDPNLYIH